MNKPHYDRKILMFRQIKANSKSTASPSKKLHPVVRRRRLFWLYTMAIVFCWAIYELTVQQVRIWDKEEELAKKSEELRQVVVEKKELEQEINKVQDEDYLIELAHKWGYSEQDEENYILKDN